MELSMTAFETCDFVDLPGEMRVAVLPSITPHLSNHITVRPHRDLVLNLSSVNYIDSSALKLFVNLHKRLESVNQRLYLFCPSDNVLKIIREVKLDQVFSFVSAFEDLDKSISAARFSRNLPFSEIINDVRALHCGCPVCRSSNVVGYLVDFNNLDWMWEGDYPFPMGYVKGTTTPVDAFGLMPLVCLDCYMCSTEITDFHLRNEEGDTVPSLLQDDAKLLLSKSIKDRKKMMDIDLEVDRTFFSHPRQSEAAYHLYLLAEACARSRVGSKTPFLPYWVGYYNYMCVKFATAEKKDLLINNCRTWLNQVVHDKTNYNCLQLSKAYFILVVSAISLGKPKEATELHSEFTVYMESFPTMVKTGFSGINSPFFWYSQAHAIWDKECKKLAM